MKKSSWLVLALLTLVAAGGWLAAAQAADKAIDPVCGMSVTKATAKHTFDYKGTTYYFCSEGCKTSFAKEPEKYLAPGAEKKMMGGMMQGQMRQAQAADPSKAVDPVCGMAVDKATAKFKSDYKGTTYYFCCQGCKTKFEAEPEKYLAPGGEKKMMGGMMQGKMMHAQEADPAKAKDPVCGMMVDKATAKWTHDYKGTTYYFCSEGCKTSFAKEPEKYLAKVAEGKPMAGMMHAQAMPAHEGMMAGCPMMLPDVERKVEVIKDGVVITLTSKNAETVKKIQEHAAKMAEAKKDAAACPMAMAEGACPACAAKK